jgi:hypothetical protein
MNSKRYRSQLAETTDDHIRYEFLRLLAQEGRQHFMRQIAEENISDRLLSVVSPIADKRGGGQIGREVSEADNARLK